MPVAVVKLGSSIVAEDSGDVRADVLAGVCDVVAARWEAGDDVVIVTSSATAFGLGELRDELLGRVPVAPPEPEGSGEDDVAEFAVFRPAASRDFSITRGPDGTWIVTGDTVERLFLRWDLENEEAQAHVERRLQRMGVIAALERAGFAAGDDVEIGGTVFELDPG